MTGTYQGLLDIPGLTWELHDSAGFIRDYIGHMVNFPGIVGHWDMAALTGDYGTYWELMGHMPSLFQGCQPR